jgi:hypothetical protein
MRRSIRGLGLGLMSLVLCALSPALAARAAPLSTYVLVGPEGQPIARAVTAEAACPDITVDGQTAPMTLRAAPAVLPLRTTASAPEDSKPAAFPVTVCERRLPPDVRRASIAGQALPLPPREIRRIVVIGDTGCRIKKSDKAAQACLNSAKYPFALIAARAAAWKPDLVLHVGDYLYRETACPEGDADCAGSPWGYGWDAWDADFFTPAAPLLRAAPLALSRGNHETCNRAGQGWLRLLDVGDLGGGRDCVDAAHDAIGDHTPPYAIPLGPQTQILMFDSAAAPAKPLDPADPRAVAFAADWDALAGLSARRPHSLLANHHPLLGFAARKGKDGGPPTLDPGNLGLQSVFARKTPGLFPPGVDVLLAGHVHVWEQLSFAGAYPSQFVVGFSGTQEDIVPLPATLPPGKTPAPGAVVAAFSSWVDGFGYMTMERTSADRWRVQVHDTAGKVVNRCTITGKRSHCDHDQVAAPAG